MRAGAKRKAFWVLLFVVYVVLFASPIFAEQEILKYSADEILERIRNDENVFIKGAFIDGSLDFTKLEHEVLPNNTILIHVHSRIDIIDSTINGSIIAYMPFTRVVFNNEVHFTDTKISGLFDFRNSHFYEEASFESAEFHGDTLFHDSQFLREANFYETQFYGYANFQGTQFSGYVYFDETQFSERADFRETQFYGYANFQGTQFYGRATFQGTQFSGIANFQGTQFSERADFRETQFYERVIFESAEFHGDTLFLDSQFLREVNFDETQFYGYATFQKTQFYGRATFYNAKFDARALFYHVIFSNNTYFTQTQFSDQVRFIGSEFRNPVSFSEVHFNSLAYFVGTRFNESYFSHAEFKEIALFTRANFNGFARFESVVFHAIADFRDTRFQNVSFSGLPSAVFRDLADFRRSWFDGASLKGARFSQVDFSGAHFTSMLNLEDTVYSSMKLDWKEVAHLIQPRDDPEVFRSLEENFKRLKRLDYANGAFYQRKIAERLNKSPVMQNLEKIFLDWTCGYGVRPQNVVIVSAILILIFSLAYLPSDAMVRSPSTTEQGKLAIHLKELPLASSKQEQKGKKNDESRSMIVRVRQALGFSFSVFTKISSGDVYGTSRVRRILILEWLLGLAMISLLLYTLSQTIPLFQAILKGVLI